MSVVIPFPLAPPESGPPDESTSDAAGAATVVSLGDVRRRRRFGLAGRPRSNPPSPAGPAVA